MAQLVGTGGYTFHYDGTVTIRAQKISNTTCNSSGTLKLELWNLDYGVGQGGYRHTIASYKLEQVLYMNECYNNVSQTLKMQQSVTRPYLALVLLAFDGGSYEREDYIQFSGRVCHIPKETHKPKPSFRIRTPRRTNRCDSRESEEGMGVKVAKGVGKFLLGRAIDAVLPGVGMMAETALGLL